jgi:hypothetical protein
MNKLQSAPRPTPLFEAAHADRYERQQLIRQYQEKYDCRFAAKAIIAAVDDAAAKVQGSPGTYALYSSLLSDVTALKVQQARSALSRTGKLLDLALHSNADRDEAACKKLKQALTKELIEKADYHGAIFGIPEAEAVGLPVVHIDPAGEQWELIWRLWTRYFVLGNVIHAYEGERASNVHAH